MQNSATARENGTMTTQVSQATTKTGLSRVKAANLKIRTNFTDITNSIGRAKALASDDWRKTASAIPEPTQTAMKHWMIRGKREHSSSSGQSCEAAATDVGSVQYRWPKKDLVPWHLVQSARPVDCRFPLEDPEKSVLSTDESMDGFTMVEVRDIKPMIMSGDGLEFVMPNCFAIDVSPIEKYMSSGSSPILTFAELRRAKYPDRHASKSSDDMDLDMADIDRILNLGHSIRRRRASISPEFLAEGAGSRHAEVCKDIESMKLMSIDTAIDNVSGIEVESPHKRAVQTEDDKTRFRSMVARLNRSYDIQAVDKAIIFAKRKDDSSATDSDKTERSQPVSVDELYLKHDDWVHLMRRGQSNDSGYLTANSDNGGSSLAVELSRDSSTDSRQQFTLDSSCESPTKRLNPAAAEFKSVKAGEIPQLSPKKLSRPPLTNIFPDAATSSVPPTTAPSANILPATTPVMMPPPPPGFSVAEMGTFSSMMPPTGAIFNPQMAALMPFSGIPPPLPLTAGSLVPSFGTSPPSPPPVVPMDVPHMQMPVINGFNTYPPPTGTVVPGLIPYSVAGAGLHQNNPAPAPATFAAHIVPSPGPALSNNKPSFGPDRKLIRPYFPVTRKPRDHDPIKQQQYEAYLEWRKANEPGYHWQCKMRQANRFKAIVEKAKAAVGAVAAAAAAERASKAAERETSAESVRETFKTKIQESCGADRSDMENTKRVGDTKETSKVEKSKENWETVRESSKCIAIISN
ncbi:hypothetical protein QBC46DRAFT_353413 [Diplogelasinospora grovesii]|uniref:Uncharacterized protein n=1 Tax=Diplogelasinospora grovesii TaxID=303347 RepID=A0AAN6N8Q4_9PEZI|nr:hypothetical protein QBC46DRAFT_353413 [Diplogelasinospora grovesii]